MEVPRGHVVMAVGENGKPIATINKNMAILMLIFLVAGIIGAGFLIFYLGGDI